MTRRGPEAQLMRSVLERIELVYPSVTVQRLNAGMQVLIGDGKRRVIRGSVAGTPDLLVLMPRGRAVFFELKSPSGRVAGVQLAWHENARLLGHEVYVCRTVDEVIAALRGGKG